MAPNVAPETPDWGLKTFSGLGRFSMERGTLTPSPVAGRFEGQSTLAESEHRENCHREQHDHDREVDLQHAGLSLESVSKVSFGHRARHS